MASLEEDLRAALTNHSILDVLVSENWDPMLSKSVCRRQFADDSSRTHYHGEARASAETVVWLTYV